MIRRVNQSPLIYPRHLDPALFLIAPNDFLGLAYLSTPWIVFYFFISKMVQETDFPPACPIPLVIQPHERIEWLKERLNEPKNQRQRTNLMTLIRMYETGELGPLTPGHTIYICDGKILNEPLSSENIPSGVTAIWAEVSLYLIFQIISYFSSRELLRR